MRGNVDQITEELLVGVVGLGAMGSAMASRLAQQGFSTVGCDVAPAARERAAENGLRCVGPEDLHDRRILVTSLPDDAAVSAALLGGDPPLLSRLGPGTVVIETSTVLPATVRQVARAAAGVGVTVVDCPVSGGPADAAAGTLTLIVGVDREVPEAAAVLGALGSAEWAGPVGAAKALKLVNNLMSMGNLLLAAEGLRFALAQGVDGHRVVDVVSRSNGASRQLSLRGRRMLDGDLAPGFAVRLAVKDLRLATSLADESGVTLPMTSAVHEALEAGVRAGLAEDDVASLFTLRAEACPPTASTSDPASPLPDRTA